MHRLTAYTCRLISRWWEVSDFICRYDIFISSLRENARTKGHTNIWAAIRIVKKTTQSSAGQNSLFCLKVKIFFFLAYMNRISASLSVARSTPTAANVFESQYICPRVTDHLIKEYRHLADGDMPILCCHIDNSIVAHRWLDFTFIVAESDLLDRMSHNVF